MSTYEELSLIVSVALLIVTILNYTKKIARPDPAKVDELFFNSLKLNRRGGEVAVPFRLSC